MCVSFSVHQYGFLHGDTFECVCLGVSGTQPSWALLGLVTTAGLCHPLAAPPPSHIFNVAFQSLFYYHIVRVDTDYHIKCVCSLWVCIFSVVSYLWEQLTLHSIRDFIYNRSVLSQTDLYIWLQEKSEKTSVIYWFKSRNDTARSSDIVLFEPAEVGAMIWIAQSWCQHY